MVDFLNHLTSIYCVDLMRILLQGYTVGFAYAAPLELRA